ncbi:hypothetical protein [Oceanicaulis sp.]|uniref:hypothetical protein n=1 Tax=Oceanicaulis sp. TaxID=1924941 RepID=UPI003F721BCF
MTQKNVTIGFPLHNATLSGGDWSTARPLDRALSPVLSDPARSAGLATADTQFVATFDSTLPTGCVALCDHNLSLQAQVRVELLNSADGVLADSGWKDAWPEVYGAFSLAWGDPSFMSLRPDARELEQEIGTFVQLFDQNRLASKVRVSIDDTANPDGFVDLGFVAFATANELTVNPQYGATEGFEARSKRQTSAGGVDTYERRNKPRIFQGELIMPRTERRSLVDRMHRELDLDGVFIFVQEPSEALFKPLTQWAARLAELTPSQRAMPDHDRVPIRFKQVL